MTLVLGLGLLAPRGVAGYDAAQRTKDNLVESHRRQFAEEEPERPVNPKYERMRERERQRDERRKAFLEETQRHETGFTESPLDTVAKVARQSLDPLDLDLGFVTAGGLSDAERAEKLTAALEFLIDHSKALTEKVRLLEESISQRTLEESEMLRKETEMLKGIVEKAVAEYKANTHTVSEAMHEKLSSRIETHRSHVKAQLEPLKKGSSGWLLPFIVLCLLFVAVAVGIYRYHRMLQKKHVL